MNLLLEQQRDFLEDFVDSGGFFWEFFEVDDS
jgi:hypothetical protein